MTSTRYLIVSSGVLEGAMVDRVSVGCQEVKMGRKWRNRKSGELCSRSSMS